MQSNSNNENPFVSLLPSENKLLKDLKVGFFIDISGSTGGIFSDNVSILDVERYFVQNIIPQLTINPLFVAWDDNAYNINNINTLTHGNGTQPACIFKNADTLSAIRQLDVAVIITDGEIDSYAIKDFGKCMARHGTHLKGIIGVIVGRRSYPGSNNMRNPSEINVSVLTPAMISNACILFHNSNDTYVMWSSGAFKLAWNPIDITDGIQWSNLTKTNAENIGNVTLPIYNESEASLLRNSGYIPFGSGLFFNPEHFLKYQPTVDELIALPFDRICQYFRVNQQYDGLMNWFKEQSQRIIGQLISDNEEKENIERMFTEMSQPRTTRQRNPTIITNFCQARNIYLARRYIDDEEINSLVDDQRIVKLLQFYRAMMQIMDEDNRTQNIGATYTCSSISSTRYSSALNTSQLQSNQSYNFNTIRNCTSITAKFNEPYLWFRQFDKLYPTHNSKKTECTICCEIGVPFILIRKHLDKTQINNLVDNSLSYYYPEILCSKCADYFCINGKDPVRQPCHAAIPIVNLIGDSKIYFYQTFSTITNYQLQSLVPITTTSIDGLYRRSVLSNNNDDQQFECLKFIILVFYGIVKQHFETPELNDIFEQFEKSIR